MSRPKWASAEVDKPWYRHMYIHNVCMCTCAKFFLGWQIIFKKLRQFGEKDHGSGWLEIKIHFASFELLEFKDLSLSALQFAGSYCKCSLSVNLRLRENKLDAAWVSSVQGQTCKGWACGHPWRWARSQEGELGIYPPRRYWSYL